MFVKLYKTKQIPGKQPDGLGSNIKAVFMGYKINSDKIYGLNEFEAIYEGQGYHKIAFDISDMLCDSYIYEDYLISSKAYKALVGEINKKEDFE